jgi:hypothetical protein
VTNKKAVALMWYCRTPKGWRRFPVFLGGNNRVKHGYVMVGGVLTHFPEGRYEIRLYENRKKVYKRAGDNAAELWLRGTGKSTLCLPSSQQWKLG